MRVESYRELIVWQRAMQLLRATYKVIDKLPPCERFELASQLRRASFSVPSNICEGHSRQHRKEFLQFLSIAHASLREVESLMLGAECVEYISEAEIQQPLALADEVSRMLRRMRQSLQAKEREAGR